MAGLHDDLCRKCIANAPDSAVAWFLMTSYLYYHEDQSIISDELFDELCKQLLERWDDVKHPHRTLISRGDLTAGTGYAIPKNRYPLITINAARSLLPPKPSRKRSRRKPG